MLKVIHVEPIDSYKLKVNLSDGQSGTFDVSPYLNKGVFRELKNKDYFSTVRVAFGGIVWPHEQDFSADTISYEMERI
ncbi:MAG: DUF2442 domain-containing protein [bacterium]